MPCAPDSELHVSRPGQMMEKLKLQSPNNTPFLPPSPSIDRPLRSLRCMGKVSYAEVGDGVRVQYCSFAFILTLQSVEIVPWFVHRFG